MIIIKITQVAMQPKPGEPSCLKVLLIDQDPALNYIKRQQILAVNRYGKESSHMGLGKKIPAFFKTGLCVFLLIGLAACQGSLTSYRGKPVEAKNRFDLLEGGPREGDWQTRDIRIEFQYLREQQDLQISGLVKPQDYLLHYNIMKSFFLGLHFVDAGGKVLVDETIMSAGYRVEMPEQMAFKANLKIPPDSTAFAFSYSGRAMISGDDSRGNGWDFWQGP